MGYRSAITPMNANFDPPGKTETNISDRRADRLIRLLYVFFALSAVNAVGVRSETAKNTRNAKETVETGRDFTLRNTRSRGYVFSFAQVIIVETRRCFLLDTKGAKGVRRKVEGRHGGNRGC